MDEPKRLYRRPDQAMIGGVAAGFADYFDLDVSVMRIIFVVFTLATSGLGIILYIILLIILPTPDTAHEDHETPTTSSKTSSGQLRDYFGVGLVLIGLWLLIGQLFPGWLVLRWDLVWPAVLIALGLVIAVKAK